MNRVLIVVTLLLIVVATIVTPAEASISVRLGGSLPQSGFKTVAGTGFAIDVLASLRSLPLGPVTLVIAFNSTNFGTKNSQYLPGAPAPQELVSQTSKISYSGGGVGLRLEPPSLILRPFAEILGRVTSVRQEYRGGTGGTNLDTKIKIGYQINAGLKYAFIPKLSFEVGGSLTSFNKAQFKDKQQTYETEPKVWGFFAGLNLGLGF